MAINLSRSTNVYLSTLGDEVFTGHNTSNTFEIRVLDDYSFSQATSKEDIALNEAGDTPVRAQKTFNTAIEPAEVSFSSYLRPYIDGANHTCIERILWEALVGKGNEGALATNPFKNTESDTTSMKVDFENSDTHVLMTFAAFFSLDNSTYQVKELTLTTAEVSFDIDGIATVAFTAKGTGIVEDTPARQNVNAWVAGVDYLAPVDTAPYIRNKLSTMTLTDNAGLTSGSQSITYGSPVANLDPSVLNGTNTYTATVTVDGGSPQTLSVDSAITGVNPLVIDVITLMNDSLDGASLDLLDDGSILITSTSHGANSSILVVDSAVTFKLFDALTPAATDVTINAAVAGTGTGKNYIIPITGGSLTIENNTTYLTPEQLGVVNTPLPGFTGTRAITGSVTAYLRTGTTASAQLLADLVAATTTVTHDFTMVLSAGGAANTPRVVFTLPHAHLVIPSLNVEDVMSVEISFTGLGQSLEHKDELLIEYVAQ